MLFRNRHGIFFSRPWSRHRPAAAKLVTLMQAYRTGPKEAQRLAYLEAFAPPPEPRISLPAAVQRPGVCEVWS